MMYFLINNFKLKVRVGRSLGEKILTNIGVAQGDCFSALLFIFCLAQFVVVVPGLPTRKYFGNKVLWSELDWLIDRDTHQVVIDLKYADDISFIRTDETRMNQVKRRLLDLLKKGDLSENESKRKTCEKSADVLDTNLEINRRKGSTISTMKTLEPLLKSHTVTIDTKLHLFKAYVQSIFLYNSELLTAKKTTEDRFESFQRKLLHQVMCMRWPELKRQ